LYGLLRKVPAAPTLHSRRGAPAVSFAAGGM